jgi:hypothetical protein
MGPAQGGVAEGLTVAGRSRQTGAVSQPPRQKVGRLARRLMCEGREPPRTSPASHRKIANWLMRRPGVRLTLKRRARGRWARLSHAANGPELRLETLAESRRTLRTFTPGGKEEKPGLNSP